MNEKGFVPLVAELNGPARTGCRRTGGSQLQCGRRLLRRTSSLTGVLRPTSIFVPLSCGPDAADSRSVGDRHNDLMQDQFGCIPVQPMNRHAPNVGSGSAFCRGPEYRHLVGNVLQMRGARVTRGHNRDDQAKDRDAQRADRQPFRREPFHLIAPQLRCLPHRAGTFALCREEAA